MQVGMDISIRQTQKLTLTPQMEQSLSVLQMGTEELNQCIEEEVLSNPMLEYAKSREKKEIRQSYGEGIGYYSRKKSEEEDYQSYLNSIADEKSYDTGLKEYLKEQLCTKKTDTKRWKRAEFLIECLEESGYLKIEMKDLAESLHITEAELEEEIRFLQELEPCGVFARNLRECLLLQLKDDDEQTKEIRALVEHHLDEIAENKLPKISKKTGLSMEQIAEDIAYIKKHLEPIPGRGFGSEKNTFIYPDITVKQKEDGYLIIYNKERVHMVELSKDYLPLLKEDHSEQEKQYLQEQYQQARFLMKNIGKREETLRLVTEAIVDYQRDFFQKGKAFLKPMNLLDIAEELQMHESTISRAVKDKYLECRFGVFEMKYFFSNKTSEGNNCNVLNCIEELIKNEDKKKPLSDAKISKQLEERGIIISRRTVAKYRDQLQIPNTQMRKEYV